MESDALSRKIKTLFEYRKIPWLLSVSEMQEPQDFLERLVDLQVAIYRLDNYLECNWKVNRTARFAHWQEIYSRLQEFGLTPYQQRSWCEEIRKYESRELQLRNQKSPLLHSIEDLYYHKSCDVRLIRRLIYNANTSLKKIVDFADWTEFDLLTEINDDIEDLFEDFHILNGNRFLFCLYEKGGDLTQEIYSDFIKCNLENARRRFTGGSSSYQSTMFDWVLAITQETEQLLEQTLRKLNMQELVNSRVLKMYNQAF